MLERLDTQGIPIALSPAQMRSMILRRVLFFSGIGLIGLGFSWSLTTTQSRLDGVGWFPADGVDEIIAVLFILFGILQIVCSFIESRWAEVVGVASCVLPLGVVGLLFLIASLTGHSTVGWVTTWSYTYMTFGVLSVATYGSLRGLQGGCRSEQREVRRD